MSAFAIVATLALASSSSASPDGLGQLKARLAKLEKQVARLQKSSGILSLAQEKLSFKITSTITEPGNEAILTFSFKCLGDGYLPLSASAPTPQGLTPISSAQVGDAWVFQYGATQTGEWTFSGVMNCTKAKVGPFQFSKQMVRPSRVTKSIVKLK